VIRSCLAALLLTLSAGCCVTPPPADKYFDRSSASDTLRFFQYAVETGQYQFAYQCLDSESRERVSEGSFEASIRWARVEALDGSHMWRVIADAFRVPEVERIPGDPEARWVTLVHFREDDTYEISLRIAPEEGEWRIDLSEMRGLDLGGTP